MFILAEIGGKTREMRYSAIALSLLLACASKALAKRPTAAGMWVGNFFQGWTNGQRMTPQYSHDLQTFLTAKKRGDVYVLKLLPGKPMNGYYEAGQFISYTLSRTKTGWSESPKQSGTWTDDIREIRLLRQDSPNPFVFTRDKYMLFCPYPYGMLEYDRIGQVLSDSDIMAHAGQVSWHFAKHPKLTYEPHDSENAPAFTRLPVSSLAPHGWIPNDHIRRAASLLPDSILKSTEFRFVGTGEERWVGNEYRRIMIKSPGELRALRDALAQSCRRCSTGAEPRSQGYESNQDGLLFNLYAEHGQKGNRILDFCVIRSQVHDWGPAFEKLYQKYSKRAFPNGRIP